MLKRLFKKKKFVDICLKEPQIVRAQRKTMLMEEDMVNSNYELDIILTPWMILSKDKEFVITADIVATICDPIDSVQKCMMPRLILSPVSETEVVNNENIKCILVGIDDVLISEIEELDAEIGDPDCKLIKP